MLRRRLFRSSTPTSRYISRRSRFPRIHFRSALRKILPFLLAVLVVFLLNRLFTVQKIDCSFNGQACPPEISNVINRLKGKNSLFIKQKEIASQIKAVYPIEKISLGFRMFNTLKIILQGNRPFVQADVYLVSELPVLSMDEAPSTTDSAAWWVKPSSEIAEFTNSHEALGFYFWDNGSMTPIATVGANLSYIFSEKPSPDTISSVYKLSGLVSKYTDVSRIYIINHRAFLSRPDQPDIIVNVPFEEGSLTAALQSLSYLSTIKKDAKVIDLCFKNPIIR